MPFPPVSWWGICYGFNRVYIDITSVYNKSQKLNRYYISSANNVNMLTLPLTEGREQKKPINELRLFNDAAWQHQHWKSLASAYAKAPYWEYYKDSLAILFHTKYDLFADFCTDSINWCARQLSLSTAFVRQAPIEACARFTAITPAYRNPAIPFPTYYQLFEDKIGFQPNISLLDLLMSEGKHASLWLKQHHSTLLQYNAQ